MAFTNIEVIEYLQSSELFKDKVKITSLEIIADLNALIIEEYDCRLLFEDLYGRNWVLDIEDEKIIIKRKKPEDYLTINQENLLWMHGEVARTIETIIT